MERTEIGELNARFAGSRPEEVIAYFVERYGDRIALSSSLGLEDQVLTDMVCRAAKRPRIFTLDTGRLFPETYSLIDRTNMHYGIRIAVYFPERQAVEQLVSECGMNCFYESIELRKRCCQVRKLEPLKRAFEGLEVWICGLRREQSVTREHMQLVEWDEAHGLVKLNPLIGWHEEEVWNYIREHHVPYNKLHDKGFPSIGCQPCTRAVEPGADIRSGRWWWESPDHRECGLHKH
ncbi:MAG: phosphoadenylyl-sulfate reductase [Rikenella sp.]|nr:phosphoadenylyl-sulfate reductase [Rikenella sp.]